MHKKLIIIQARIRSTRLPGKILLKICDKEIITHLLDRIMPTKQAQHIIVATTTARSDDQLLKLLENYHPMVSVYRGSEHDVLDRYYQAASAYIQRTNETYDIVRITSDCPLLHFQIVDEHLTTFDQQNAAYLSSRINKRTWPHGMELEIFTFKALEQAWKQAYQPYEREHVTPYIYKTRPDQFIVYEYKFKKDLSWYRFTLDYWEDYLFIKEIYLHLYPRDPLFTFKDILKLLEKKPELLKINQNKIHNEI
jgi:spore coat polysaccharide biosynthesis protein SpsF